MNVTIIYFSQTGQTRTVAETMAEVFREKGHATRTISLGNAIAQDAASGHLLGIGTPCFSSQAPTPIKAFLRSLPPLEGQRTFVFATSGGAPGKVLYDLAQLLQLRGAEVIGGFLCRGAVHHPAPCMVNRYPNRPNSDDLASARSFAAAIARHAKESKAGLVSESYPGTLNAKGVFYNAVGILSTDSFLRHVLPEPRLYTTKCDLCQWCADECPMQNITLQPYPILGKKCIRCYRCLTNCPQQAYTVDWKLGNLAIWMFYNTTFVRWFGNLRPGEAIYQDERI